MELHVSEVLRYGESAQAVTRVVEISGSEDGTKHDVENRVNGTGPESVCVCVSRWCGTDLPGLSSRPPVGL